MKDKIYHTPQILFEYQCYESFDNMPLSENGRYCGSCKKNLIDFTGKTYEEIKAYLKQHQQEEVCGVFHPQSATAEAIIHPKTVQKNNIFSNAAGVFIAISATLASCNTSNEKNSETKPEKSMSVEKESISKNENDLKAINSLDKNKINNQEVKKTKANKTSIKHKEMDEVEESFTSISHEPPTVLGGIPVPDYEMEHETKDGVCTYVDVPAEFNGGNEAMFSFIHKNLNYPKSAKEHGLEGKVFIEFVVRTNGKISDVKVKKGIAPELDEAAIEVIKKMPDWIPAKKDNKNVASFYIIPILFTLK